MDPTSPEHGGGGGNGNGDGNGHVTAATAQQQPQQQQPQHQQQQPPQPPQQHPGVADDSPAGRGGGAGAVSVSPSPGLSVAPIDVDIVSVDDHDAFANKHLTDMGEEVHDFKVFTWKLSDYRRADKRLLSPEFSCGGHKWNVLLFPMGNSNGQANDMVSVYLNYGDQKASEGWHVCAQFALAISNPSDPTVYIQSRNPLSHLADISRFDDDDSYAPTEAHHRFTQEEQDWGFTRFVELRKLFSVSEGRPKPIIENDETIITAFVRVLKDPTGVLWHNFHNYDSKKETGHVGLKNQGATCYMNSLLQSLFLTNSFRKAVYQIPTEDDTIDTVPLALQRVFYNLQTSDQSVGTTELTRSFGWKGFDSFLQHDVQEFNRVLCDKLETKMKGTAADGEIKRLFSGTMKSYIKCINIDFESARTEDFYDIQLNVKDMPNLEASFKDYIAMETLEGENKYNAEGFGLQDAKKGVIFESFPPVLHLQLKRFEYDMQRDQNVKVGAPRNSSSALMMGPVLTKGPRRSPQINDRHEFPLEINLEPYLSEQADRSESYNYKLHGVLVHSGDVHGGHYFVLIKPSADGRWLRFDDDRVVPVTDREVLEDNFGGEPLLNNGAHPPNAKPAMKRFTNAYMLVYIRESRVREILDPITIEQVPEHLRLRLERERRDAEMRKRERDEQHLYLTVKLITDETFSKHQGFDLATFDDRTVAATELPTYRILKAKPYVEFRAEIAHQHGYNPEDIRLWVLVNRQNKTVRPDAPISDGDPTLTMEVVRDKMASRQQDLKLYLEYISKEEKAEWQKNHQNEPPIMVFVKNFDVAHQTLAGLGHFHVHRHMRVLDLAQMINDRMGFPPSTPLKIYEEIKPNMIELMKMKATFLQSEIQDGDIVCFQVDMTERDSLPQDLDKQNMFTTPIQFYDFFLNRVVVTFKPKYDDANAKEEFEITLSKKNNYDQMAGRVGERLKHDPLKLRFTQANGQNGQPKTIVRRQGSMTVAELVSPSYNMTHAANLLYYEMLDVSIIELETKKSLRISWVGPTNKEESSHGFLLPKNTTIHDCAQDWLRKDVRMQNGGSGEIRIFDIVKGTIQRIYTGSELVRDVSDQTELFAEEVPLEESRAADGSRVVPCFHYNKEPSRTHGIPFRFVLKPHETFNETKKRLQARLGLGDKEFAKIKFSMLQNAMYHKPMPLNNGDVLFDHKWQDDDFIGLDHPDRRRAPAERGVQING
ncbi:BQ2448_5665 [Microbotryum intermedium]|uniref:ubiquitinyl hydrolase 1 n=1 Tax=Microbotryum intermedium TaxID=269621 RepID=A0A238F2T1_9BASI|nr:BQ2448_5665 [Microbotryum intermedium]